MRIREIYFGSYLYRIISILFLDNACYPVGKSRIGKVFSKVYLPYATEACLALSVILFWYEGFFSRYMPSLGIPSVASGLILIGLLLAKKENIVFGKTQLWYLSFLALSLISSFFAGMRGIDPTLLISGWLLFAQFGLVMFAAQSIGMNILKAIAWISAPLSLMGLYQFIFRVETSPLWVSSSEKSIDTRAFAFFGSPNVLGILLAMVAILSAGLYLASRKNQYLIIALLNAIVTGLTFSRSAWLGLVAGLVFMIVIYRPKLMLWSPIVVLIFLIPKLRDRISVAFSDRYLVDSSLDGRVWSFINSTHIFQKYPFFGTGPGSYGGKIASRGASPIYLEGVQKGYTALYFTDNQFLEILVQTGVFGTTALLGFITSIILAMLRKFKDKKDIIALSAISAFICFLISGMFANVLEFGALAVPMGIILGSALGGAKLNS